MQFYRQLQRYLSRPAPAPTPAPAEEPRQPAAQPTFESEIQRVFTARQEFVRQRIAGDYKFNTRELASLSELQTMGVELPVCAINYTPVRNPVVYPKQPTEIFDAQTLDAWSSRAESNPLTGGSTEAPEPSIEARIAYTQALWASRAHSLSSNAAVHADWQQQAIASTPFTDAQKINRLGSRGGAQRIVTDLRTHMADEAIVQEICVVLRNCSCDFQSQALWKESANCLLRADAIPALREALRLYSDNDIVATAICRILHSVSRHRTGFDAEPGCQAVLSANIIPELVILANRPRAANQDIAKRALPLLCNLLVQPNIRGAARTAIITHYPIPRLLARIRNLQQHADLQLLFIQLLATLMLEHPATKYAIAENRGAELLLDVLQRTADPVHLPALIRCLFILAADPTAAEQIRHQSELLMRYFADPAIHHTSEFASAGTQREVRHGISELVGIPFASWEEVLMNLGAF